MFLRHVTEPESNELFPNITYEQFERGEVPTMPASTKSGLKHNGSQHSANERYELHQGRHDHLPFIAERYNQPINPEPSHRHRPTYETRAGLFTTRQVTYSSAILPGEMGEYGNHLPVPAHKEQEYIEQIKQRNRDLGVQVSSYQNPRAGRLNTHGKMEWPVGKPTVIHEIFHPNDVKQFVVEHLLAGRMEVEEAGSLFALLGHQKEVAAAATEVPTLATEMTKHAKELGALAKEALALQYHEAPKLLEMLKTTLGRVRV